MHLATPNDRDRLASSARIDASLEAIIRRTRPDKVVFSSTGAVYGDQAQSALNEDSPTLGSSDYALSKLTTERLLRNLTHEDPLLAVTTLRIFNIAGPQFPASLVQRLIGADRDHPVTLTAPDRFVRDYIHQSDIVRVVLAALSDDRPGYRVINVGAGSPVTTTDLVASLDVPPESWVEVDGNGSYNWADNSRLKATLGVTPHVLPTRAWAAPQLE